MAGALHLQILAGTLLLAMVAGPTPRDELDRLWSAIAATDGIGQEFRLLVGEAKGPIRALAGSTVADRGVLIEVLGRPDKRTLRDGHLASYYTELRVEILGAFARDPVLAATPVLEEIVRPAAVFDGPPSEPLVEFSKMLYRREADAAARALGALKQTSSIPILRAAFREAFTHLPLGAELFNTLPEVLILLGDRAYVDRAILVALSNRDDHLGRSKAAYLAQKLDCAGVVPVLIGYLEDADDEDENAQLALEKASGQDLVGTDLWNAWWKQNEHVPRAEWQDLILTRERKQAATNALATILQRRYLGVHPYLWSRHGQPSRGLFDRSALDWVVRKVRVLGVEESIRDYLEQQLASTSMAAASRRLPGGEAVGITDVPPVGVADNARRILDALSADTD